MNSSSKQDLEAWITSRRNTPNAQLAESVMQTLHEETQPLVNQNATVPPRPKPPAWLLSSGCLLIGIGKISLILHLAF